MKPVIFSTLAMICYALANVLVEQKLSRLNSLNIMLCYSPVIFLFAFVVRQISNNGDTSFRFPSGLLLWIALGVGLLFAFADYFFITAYTNTGKLVTVTSIFILFPVCASVVKFLLTKEMPNWWHICGYTLAILAVLCIVRGNGIQSLQQ